MVPAAAVGVLDAPLKKKDGKNESSTLQFTDPSAGSMENRVIVDPVPVTNVTYRLP